MTTVARGEIDLTSQGDALAEVKRTVASIKAQIESLDHTKAEIPIDASTRGIDKKLADLNATLAALEKRKVEIEAALDTKEFDRGVDRVENQMKKLGAQKFLRGLNTEVTELKKSLDEVNTSLATSDKIKTLAARNHAKEALEVATLAKRYKDLSDRIDESTFKQSGFGGAGSRFESKKNIEIGIDDDKARAEMKLIVAELEHMGEHKTVIHMQLGDNDTDKLSKFKGLLGAISERIGALGKLRVNFGPISGSIGSLATSIAGALPLVTNLGGALVSLLGVTGSGALGAGAVGGGLFSGLLLNLGGVASVVKEVTGEFTEADKALTHYEETVKKFGAGSKEAIKAQAQLNNVLAQVDPSVASAIKSFEKLKEKWAELVLPTGRKDIGKILNAGLATANILQPGFAANTNATLQILTEHLDSIFKHLREPVEAKAFVGLGESANKFLGPALGGLERFGAGILHVFEAAARIFAGPLGKALFDMGEDFNKATEPGKKLDATLEKMGHNASDVFNFFKALGKVLVDVLGGSVKAGDEFVRSMTRGLEKWDQFLKSTDGKNKTGAFFKEAVEGTEALWGIVAPLTKLLFSWATALTPAVNTIIKIAQGLTEAFNDAGKLLGLTTPLATLGVVIGSAFAVSKFAAFASFIGGLILKIKELIVLTQTVGVAGAVKSLLTGGAAAAAGAGIAGAGGAAAGGAGAAAAARTAAVSSGAASVAAASGGGGAAVTTGVAVLGVALSGGLALAVTAGLAYGVIHFETKAKDYGKEFGENFVAPFGGLLDKEAKKHFSGALKDASNQAENSRKIVAGPRGDPTNTGTIAQAEPSKAAKANVIKDEERLGKLASEAFVRGAGQVKFPTEFILHRRMEEELNKLPPVARLSAAKSMLDFAHELEHKGEIPKGSVDKLIKELEQRFPNLASYLASQGAATAKALAKPFEINEAKNALKSALDASAKLFFTYNVNTLGGATTAMGELAQIIRHSKGPLRTAAEEAYGGVKQGAEHLLELTKGNVEGLINGMNARVTLGMETFNHGLKTINKALEGELKELGVSKEVGKALVTGKPETNLKENPTPFSSKAQGGLVQFGSAGASGHDNIPVHMMVGSGEQGAVFTKQQQAVANEHLASIGGLAGLFANVNTPHWMATGGFAGSNYPGPRGRIDQGVDFAGPGPVRAVLDGVVKSTGLWHGWPGTGGMVYDTAKGLIYIMEDFVPAVKAGTHVKKGQLLGTDTGGAFGIETGWANSSGTGPQVPYNGLPDGTPTAGGKAFAAFLGSGVGAGIGSAISAAWKKITAPSGGSGIVGSIVSAALKQTATAANKFGEAHASRASGLAGSLAGERSKGGAASANEKLGRSMMIAAGFAASEWPFLQKLWTQESGWNSNSVNSSSGAYGIPQALGHGHPFNLGEAGKQIAWGLNYIKGRSDERTPKGAWAHEVSHGWYQKGGFFDHPALLVGEHENEYVINPKRADNAAYLMQAGADMGYTVTAAKSGKGKPKPSGGGTISGVVSPGAFAQLNLPQNYSAGGVPEKEITKLLDHITKEYDKEKGKLASLRTRADHEKKAINEAKHAKGVSHDKAKFAAETALENAKRSSGASLAAAKQTLDQAKSKPIDHKTAAEGGNAAAEASKAHSVQSAEKTYARIQANSRSKISAAEKAAKHKITEAERAAVDKLVKAELKWKDTERGVKTIDSDKGGNYENVKWPGFKTVVADLHKARDDKHRIEAYNEKMAALNTTISDDQAKLANSQKRFAHYKAIGSVAGMRDETKKFNAILHDRRVAIDEQRANYKKADKAAKEMKAYAEGDESKKEFAALENTIAKEETTAEAASDETKESEEIGGPEKVEPAGPPTSEEFLKQQGKLEGPGGLQSLERDFALSQTKIIPDNPNTPINEELPGLREERGPAEKLTKFWEQELAAGEALKEPDVTIKDLANQVTSARATSLGLAKSIEDAEKNQTTTQLQENTAFSQARLELFRNFGSNFQLLAPVGSGPAQGLATSVSAGAQPQKNVNVNVTNHFSEPPANPHHWSNSVRWELGAAI